MDMTNAERFDASLQALRRHLAHHLPSPSYGAPVPPQDAATPATATSNLGAAPCSSTSPGDSQYYAGFDALEAASDDGALSQLQGEQPRLTLLA